MSSMPNLRTIEAAALLGVSDDTVRRWVEQGRLDAVQERGRMAIEGRKLAESPEPGNTTAASARNRLPASSRVSRRTA
jgi:excisionase family DNA binding protein